MTYTEITKRGALLAAAVLIIPTAFAFAQPPTLSLSASSGASGSPVTVNGMGFRPGEPVSIWFGGARTTSSSSGSSYADATGAFSIPMTVPWGISGTTVVTAQGDSSGMVASLSFDITSNTPAAQGTSGTLSVSPHDAAPGTAVTVSGSAFANNSAITIYFGSAVAGTVTADYQGHFLTTVIVPSLPEGLVIVTATGANPYNPPKFYVDAGGTSSPPVVTAAATLSISPTSGASGTDIALSGSGFSQGETVAIAFGSYATSVVADTNGNVGLTLTAPYPSTSENVTVTATGDSSGRTASATFSDVVPVVTQTVATISLSTASGVPGTSVAVNGAGFNPGEGISLWFGPAESSTVANTNGAFSITLAAPSVASSGDVTVSATGQSSGKSASATFSDAVAVTTPSAPSNATLQAEIVALQQEVAQLSALLNSWVNGKH